MSKYLSKVVLPDTYDYYVFDLYGTLVDIHTEEDDRNLWEKMCLFYGYYDAHYTPEEMQAIFTLKADKDMFKISEDAEKELLNL